MEKKYEIARMEIYFVSSSYSFVRDKACGNYSNTHFNITIGCAGEYVHGKIVQDIYIIISNLSTLLYIIILSFYFDAKENRF